ncbi:MAG: hypothetical protein KIT72_03770 [Polyangiaceae bacterium]|nr:hypothetical protein [Polyangiaceae bacterium]MCW5789520.1 hypothetical protein [Polyangiaceae bacterium]
MRSRKVFLYVLLMALALLACKKSDEAGAEGSPPVAIAFDPEAVLQSSGEVDVELKLAGDKATLRAGDANFDLELKGTQVTLSQEGNTVYKLTREADRIKIRLPDGTVTHKLKFKKDDRLELEEESGKRLHLSKPKDYGYKVYDGSENELIAVKQKEKRVEAKRKSGEEVWRIEGVGPKAASILGYEELKPELRAALMYMLHRRPA